MNKTYKIVKRIIFTCFAIAIMFQVSSIMASAATTVEGTVSGVENHEMAWEILDIVNQERAAVGLPALTMDSALLDYGMLRATECAIYYSHTRPDGSPWSTGMPSYMTAGENIAAGYSGSVAVMAGWMDSPGHKENILKTGFTNIGIGVYLAEGRYYYAQVFSGTATTEAVRTTEQKPTTLTTDILTTGATITTDTVQSYDLHMGQSLNWQLPNLYIQKGSWSVKISIKESDLSYKMTNEAVATVTGTEIEGVGLGTTTLNVFINGDESATVTFNVAVTGHSYVSNVVASTCATGGYTEHICSCGDTYQDNIQPASTHNYQSTIVAPTCASGGYTEHICSDCGDTYQDNIQPASTHNYQSTIVAPTCVSGGYTEHICSDCGDTYQDNIQPASTHNYQSIVVAPTCASNGYTEHTCSDCGVSYQDNIQPASTHSYQSIVVAPTCVSDGYTEHTCSDCGATYQDNIQSALSHNYQSTVVAPTCVSSGYTEHTCSDCGVTHQDNIQPALAHNYQSTVVAPTCTTSGYTKHECDDCGDIYQDAVQPSLGHDYQVMLVVLPTCTTDGYTEHECSNCGDIQTTVQPAGHDYKETLLEPTCIKDGYTEYECNDCGDLYRDAIQPACGHEYGAWIIAVETPTTITEKRTCKHGDAVEVRSYAKSNNNTGNTVNTSNANKADNTNAQNKVTAPTTQNKVVKTSDMNLMTNHIIVMAGALLMMHLMVLRKKQLVKTIFKE